MPAPGWGAHLGKKKAQGQWNSSLGWMLYNYRELKAVGEALKTFQVSSDNAPVVAYRNRQGGTRSRPLLKLSKEILDWVEGKIISISAVYIKGTSSTEADFLSHQPMGQGEWELNPKVFQNLVQCFGNLEIDLFANLQN